MTISISPYQAIRSKVAGDVGERLARLEDLHNFDGFEKIWGPCATETTAARVSSTLSLHSLGFTQLGTNAGNAGDSNIQASSCDARGVLRRRFGARSLLLPWAKLTAQGEDAPASRLPQA